MAYSDVMGELFIWTDIDPAHEADFNRWYDREHMAERAAIPGFVWARRYRARQAAPRYLALYRTDSLSVFGSEAYRQAFSQQTAWSLANFGRMRNTRRRVMAVTPLGGYGTGAILLLIPQAPSPAAVQALLALDGVLGLRRLTPDPALSTPLPSEDAATRVLAPVCLVEAATPEAAQAVLGQHPDAQVFDLLWDLQSAELSAPRAP
ncbi:DUF4286 family protein [Bordetella pseudohinzii]|uniref:Uncharacterized protein n=1 Tax=Bordetella pseudohinzii TaxID=1331258 RepID=A0A0J6C9S6_9BORD|nr:DUF4286 family protein [Bordetella pseudohinzii]ANY16340.1 hypothetical protein BBN53_10800 [Bordetella pseudohinzii]KMM27471.1 hypothetical protein L540_00315 [Bordetella pseudohinzii]KXA78441.1 hypothetical protein AW877_11505 [Bordetella pseudohinzii]KXA80656.1 hypothetical protein AW878_07010 [Bordetella pseudohinzii]CUI39509.1 Uncharacterised protein [Bordetella pseudohinzii]